MNGFCPLDQVNIYPRMWLPWLNMCFNPDSILTTFNAVPIRCSVNAAPISVFRYFRHRPKLLNLIVYMYCGLLHLSGARWLLDRRLVLRRCWLSSVAWLSSITWLSPVTWLSSVTWLSPVTWLSSITALELRCLFSSMIALFTFRLNRLDAVCP